MLSIISPDQFKQIPWKNGKGVTTELAINDGGTLTNFEWRLSIASVVSDGEFSDFRGYWRNLVLISGEGISLQHTFKGETNTDHLTQLLQLSNFDGGSKTQGKLISGDINDLNIMTKTGKYRAKVSTYTEQKSILIKPCDLCFVYSITDKLTVKSATEKTQKLPAKHLLKISSPRLNAIAISGAMMIVIHLFKN
ncbi:MAG: hypothetical protein COB35_04515 [Gammaproteobacteria bacterium]|nr:MAG: hypothetical protein COB35_04515 [Gammaproteobacteria bacterium]